MGYESTEKPVSGGSRESQSWYEAKLVIDKLAPYFDQAKKRIGELMTVEYDEAGVRINHTLLDHTKQRLDAVRREFPHSASDKVRFDELTQEACELLESLGIEVTTWTDAEGNSLFGEKNPAEAEFAAASAQYLNLYKRMWDAEGNLGISVIDARERMRSAFKAYLSAWSKEHGDAGIHAVAGFYEQTLLPVMEEQKKIQEKNTPLPDAPKRRSSLTRSLLRVSVLLLSLSGATNAEAPTARRILPEISLEQLDGSPLATAADEFFDVVPTAEDEALARRIAGVRLETVPAIDAGHAGRAVPPSAEEVSETVTETESDTGRNRRIFGPEL